MQFPQLQGNRPGDIQTRAETAARRRDFLAKRHQSCLDERHASFRREKSGPASREGGRIPSSASGLIPRPFTTGQFHRGRHAPRERSLHLDEEPPASLRQELFKQVFRDNIPPRPSYVFKIDCQPRLLNPLQKKVSTCSSVFYKQHKISQKYYFISPEWDSEKLTVQRLCHQGKQDSLRYSWM